MIEEDIDVKEEDLTVPLSEVNMEHEVSYTYVCPLLDIFYIFLDLFSSLITICLTHEAALLM